MNRKTQVRALIDEYRQKKHKHVNLFKQSGINSVHPASMQTTINMGANEYYHSPEIFAQENEHKQKRLTKSSSLEPYKLITFMTVHEFENRMQMKNVQNK